MEILVAQFSGPYQTNCYIIDRKIVIDPGAGAFEWIKEISPKPVAIINTHGHFDHIWDNGLIQSRWQTPVYIHRDDLQLVNRPQLGIVPPPFKPTYLLGGGEGREWKKEELLATVSPDRDKNSTKVPFPPPKPIGKLKIAGYTLLIYHFPGHTPGSIAIKIENNLFAGDFIFAGGIGRVDFPLSNPVEMKKSLQQIFNFPPDLKVYPGHGPTFTLASQLSTYRYYLSILED